MNVSKHGRKRMKERYGISKKSADRMAKIVFEQGLTHQEVTGSLCRWVDGLYLKHHVGNQIRLYGDKAYIFHNESLITVIPIPKNLQTQVNNTFKKRKHSNVK